MKKGYWWTTLPLAIFIAGCEDPCKTGVELRNNEVALETAVASAIAEPSALAKTCYEFTKSWSQRLTNGARFATKAASDYFYYEDRQCIDGHYDYRCHYGAYPDPRYSDYPGLPNYDDCHHAFV